MNKRDVESDDPIPHQAFSKAWGAPDGIRETFERLGLVQRDFHVRVETGAWKIDFDAKKIAQTFDDIENAFDDIEAEVEYRYLVTAYAVRFRKACCGPRR